MKPENTIPQQVEGVEVNVEDAVTFASENEAKAFFATAKKRLLQVNNWHELAGTLSASFQLTNEKGDELNQAPAKGNFFRINIPAPGIVTGEGYDWVRIEDVTEGTEGECEFVTVRVRPASSPLNNHKDVAHFYTDEATSNFIVRRDGKTVTAGVYGRNEKPNLETDTVIDKIRNAVVGAGGVSGFAQLQWKALVKGILSADNPH